MGSGSSAQQYFGPCPGGSTHPYTFTPYALNTATVPGVNSGSSMAQIETAIKNASMAKVALRGNSDAIRSFRLPLIHFGALARTMRVPTSVGLGAGSTRASMSTNPVRLSRSAHHCGGYDQRRRVSLRPARPFPYIGCGP